MSEIGISAALARRAWDEQCRRRDKIFVKWDEISENPTPEGHKRCMHCLEAMPWEENCECLLAVGKDIRRKALAIWGPLAKQNPAQVRTRKKKKNDSQAALFS